MRCCCQCAVHVTRFAGFARKSSPCGPMCRFGRVKFRMVARAPIPFRRLAQKRLLSSRGSWHCYISHVKVGLTWLVRIALLQRKRNSSCELTVGVGVSREGRRGIFSTYRAPLNLTARFFLVPAILPATFFTTFSSQHSHGPLSLLGQSMAHVGAQG